MDVNADFALEDDNVSAAVLVSVPADAVAHREQFMVVCCEFGFLGLPLIAVESVERTLGEGARVADHDGGLQGDDEVDLRIVKPFERLYRGSA